MVMPCKTSKENRTRGFHVHNLY